MEIAMNRYTVPMDSLVATIVSRLDDVQREEFEERAAIMEYDALLPRAHAECLALLDLLQRYPAILCGVSVLQVDVDGATEWYLTDDIHYAQNRLSEMSSGRLCGIECVVLNAAEVIREQFSGLAMLANVGN